MLRIATRKSPLALQQAKLVAAKLQNNWPDLEVSLVPMTTSGDKFLDAKLLSVGGKGLFVKELELALQAHHADIAVHSMKDVPAQLPAGLTIDTICKRDNPFDAFLSTRYPAIDSLDKHCSIGTSSLRRQAQLLAYRPDIRVEMLRGNINTRLEKLHNHQFDAIILACAGLERMDLHEQITQPLSPTIMLPACGQGAIGIECRANDEYVKHLISGLNCVETALCVKIEREVNKLLGGHCHAPIAIFAHFTDAQTIELETRVYNHNGVKKLLWKQSFPSQDASKYAAICAEELLSRGALDLINYA